ncbi:DUF2147 domain-containing protein [Sphingomonas glacialis]|uniref:DUF2147 domain-containing protein n=1 Tax=Sphingomonas glacialis TaxID=658225 RepID=A0A502FYZ8_9SPHN|nr:DUF2147 domain-containing protein [Sphingomonas glacialis]TPG54123.1 DUF2147 domain-containing protein [Sphingomonas glacialis]
MSLLLIGALLAGAPATADTVIGRWKTETHNAIVEISHCGASICGKIVTSDALRSNPALKDSNNSDVKLRMRPVQGMLMLSGFSPDKDGVWANGQVYNAQDGRTYSGRITPLGNDQLKLRGCVFFPLCKTQTWTRVR